jgi:hypothetical protein
VTSIRAGRQLANEDVLRAFVDSVVALAEDPCRENLDWYLAASRAIDESRQAVDVNTNERSS